MLLERQNNPPSERRRSSDQLLARRILFDGNFERVAAQVRAKHEVQYRTQPSVSAQLTDEMEAIVTEQKGIIQQISDRAKAGRSALAALDDMLDNLELKRQETERKLATHSGSQSEDLSTKLEKLYEETKPESVELIFTTWLHYIRNHATPDVKQRSSTSSGV